MDRHDPRRFRLDYYPHVVEIASRYADVDDLGHINNLALAALYEDGRTRFFMDHDIWKTPQEREGGPTEGVMMVVSLQIDFIAQTHYPDPIIIHNGVCRMGRRSFSTHQLATQNGAPVSLCEATFAYVGAQGAVAMPAAIVASLADVLVQHGNGQA